MSAPRDLIPHYIGYIRRHSHLATRDTDYSPLELAAHLFAVAQQLVDDDHDLRNLPLHPGFASLADLEARLSGLPDELTAVELYQLLIVAMTTIEAMCCTDDDEGYSDSVRPEELEIGDRSRLGGRVVYWVRRHRLYRTLRSGGFAGARGSGAHLPPVRREHPGRHLDRLFCFWAAKNQVPEIVRAVPEEDRAFLMARGGEKIAAGEPFRIALCPLVGEAKPQFVLAPGPESFRASRRRPMAEPEGHAVRDQLEVILDLADRESLDLVVLPELMVDPETREWLVRRLATSGSHRPSGLIAGSFHFDRNGDSRPWNESSFVDESGRHLLKHHKRGCFRITRTQLEACLEDGFFADVEAVQEALEMLSPGTDVEEYISPGRRIELLESALGQIAVLICADAIDPDRREMLDAVTRLRPDFVFVPSMSFETLRFERFADDMERHGVATLFVNAHCACPQGETLAAVCLDLYRGKNDPATRFRWRRGHPELEEWRRDREHVPTQDGGEGREDEEHGARGRDANVSPEAKPAGYWRDLKSTRSPARFLHGPDHAPLGLVLDLGAYWRGGD